MCVLALPEFWKLLGNSTRLRSFLCLLLQVVTLIEIEPKVYMNHKGVEYTVIETTTPGIWKWQFQLDDAVKSGQTETRIELLARRRVQLRINQALRISALNPH